MTEENKEVKSTEQELAELNAKYERERTRAQRFDGELEDTTRKLNAYTQFGDAETIDAKLKELDALKREKAGKSEEDLDKLINERLSDAQNAIKQRDDKIKALSEELHEIQVVSKAWDTIGTEFKSDAGKLLKNHLKQNLMLTEDGQIAVKAKDGKPAYIDGIKLKTVKDYAEELKAEYPSLVADKSVSGTLKTNGTTRADSNNTVLDFEKFKNLSPSEIREQARIRAEQELNKN